VFRLAEKYYGRVAARSLPARKPAGEPAQVGVKRIEVKAPAKLSYINMAYRVPTLRDVAKDREPYALQVLSGLLDGNDAARFNRELVRGSKIAVSAGSDYDATVRGQGLFYLEGTPAEGKSAMDLEQAMRAAIDRIKTESVSASELQRVKTQLIAAQVYKRDSMMAQAMEIGGVEAVGLNWRDLDTIIEKLRGVTADDVKAVATKYFKDDSLTVAVLDPQPLGDKKPRAAVAGGNMVH
jgi:zinc protease